MCGERLDAVIEARDMRNWRWSSKMSFALLVAAFAYWVWPTPWAYSGSQDGEMLTRRNRITGRVEFKLVGYDKHWRSSVDEP